MKRNSKDNRRRRVGRLTLLGLASWLMCGCTISTYVNRATFNVPNDHAGTAFVTVSCLSGHNATGGGARVNPGDTGATLRTSEPSPPATLGTPTGWRAGFDGAAGHQIEVFVVCAGDPQAQRFEVPKL
ncbi:MAG: hypothetical protein MPN21_23770 [Thermoanaerobaculia bacterium]|nr:hypothetical protein [Thermoanaerobaculia bacterium]